jgi:DNA mismatch endonuclease (patch repair protein)
MDTLSPAARSALMGRIRSKATKPELLVQAIARRIRRHFQVNSPRLPGKPDLAFFRLKKAVFVHGCFWHQHKSCSRSNIPKSRTSYWVPKLRGNVRRDRRARQQLRSLGWTILVIWECECRDSDRLLAKLERFLAMPPP